MGNGGEMALLIRCHITYKLEICKKKKRKRKGKKELNTLNTTAGMILLND